MANQDHDKYFFNQFGVVMGALFVIFAICISAARLVSPDHREPTETELALLRDRLAPVGTVITDPEALVAAAAPVEAREPMTGQQVVTQVCAACHATGVLGAPADGDTAAWQARLDAAGGVDGLTESAIAGKGAMPPRGGKPDLSDEEVHAAVELLLSDAGL